ncbi:MAG: biopolymer transporter ExbD [Burkholderiaceae bacterium]|jgi:biopolymer transport protein TolR|nr:biopolymer transporter ExbD [Burkholderiaceae bacterium]
MAFGRFGRASKSGGGNAPMSDINVTPLVDVMLVLLVIFIITAPLLTSAIRLDLPKTDAAKNTEPPRFVTLVVDKTGMAYFNDKPVTREELAAALQQAARDNPETEVQLRADQSVPYGRVVEVMGEAQKAGLNRIGFVAEPGAAGSDVAPPATKPAAAENP